MSTVLVIVFVACLSIFDAFAMRNIVERLVKMEDTVGKLARRVEELEDDGK